MTSTILLCPHPTAGATRLIEFQGNHYRANGELISCFSWRFEISTEIVIQYNPYKLSPTVWSLQRHETNQRIKQTNESSSQGSVIKQRWIHLDGMPPGPLRPHLDGMPAPCVPGEHGKTEKGDRMGLGRGMGT
jgi:hypothetical protein